MKVPSGAADWRHRKGIRNLDLSASTQSTQDGAEPVRPPVFVLHIDDTGSRRLDRLSATANQYPTWFALGGVLVATAQEQECKRLYGDFKAAWPDLTGPLHITDMRARRRDFAWLERLSDDDQKRFWHHYHEFLGSLPLVGHACVIHRPGYLNRGYGQRAGEAKWNLCRTAFNIVVERAAKYASSHGGRLRVEYEGSDRDTDQAIRGYFALLKNGNGLGFDKVSEAKYEPIDPGRLGGILIDLERKDKRSKLMQIADSFVYAMARGRYEPSLDIYKALRDSGRIVDDCLQPTDQAVMGVKYSCFDGVP